MKPRQRSIAIVISYLIDAVALVLAVGAFFIHWGVGIAVLLVLFPYVFLPGSFIREHYELESMPPVAVTVQSKYEAFRESVGVVEKDLRPFGYVRVHDNQVPASAQCGYLPKGAFVKVVDVKTDKVIVTEVIHHDNTLDQR